MGAVRLWGEWGPGPWSNQPVIVSITRMSRRLCRPGSFFAVLLTGSLAWGCLLTDDPIDEIPDETPPGFLDGAFDVFVAPSGEFEVPAFSEVTRCAVVRMDNLDPFYVSGYKAEMLPGSHHFNLFWIPEGSLGEPRLGDCDMNAVRFFFAGSQWESVEEYMPEDRAVKIPERSDLLLEVHYLNTGPEPITGHVEVTLRGADPATLVDEIGTYMNLMDGFQIPPHSERTYAARCPVVAGSHVWLLTSHSHWRTDLFEIFRYREGSDELELLYESRDPLHPELMRFDEPLVFEEGEGFEFRCHWRNDTDQHVRNGPDADDEMCIMAAFYYPDAGLPWLYCPRTGVLVED
jgi:hypothetical protein